VSRRLNDVFFAVHASLAGAGLLWQIAIYEKGGQTLSTTCKRVMAALAVGLAIAMACSLWPSFPWEPLDFFYLLGYIKARMPTQRAGSNTHNCCECNSSYVLLLSVALAFLQVVITVIKYMPQVRHLPTLPSSENVLTVHPS